MFLFSPTRARVHSRVMQNSSNNSSIGSSSAGFVVIEGDREEDLALQQKQHDAAEEILKAIGGVLQGADSNLTNLEQNVDLLPTAILRKCQELADGIGDLAGRLEEHSPEEQRALARACAQDFQQLDASFAAAGQHSLELQANRSSDDGDAPATPDIMDLRSQEDRVMKNKSSPSSSSSPTSLLSTTTPTEDEFLQAIQGAATLLRDVEAAFREISETDAEDIADAALTLARLFLISLQNVHETLTPHDLLAMESSSSPRSMKNNNNNSSSHVVIEELDENGENKSSDDDENKSSSSKPRYKQSGRVRVLWPRLGPHVANALDWGKEAATQRPLLAVALGLTLWPAAIAATFVGGSFVLADHVVQDIYQYFQDGPLLSNLEQGAAQLLQAGKLSIVLSLVVGKQTWRVVQRQVKRRGGVEQIAHSVTEAAIERVTHPIETLGMAWNGLAWGVSTVTDTVQQILQQREELLATQELQ